MKAARTVVTSNDKSVTINKTENGNQVTYDLHVNAAAGTASTWNLKSGVASATEGTHAGDTAQNIADGKSVTMQAGKNLTVKQTNDEFIKLLILKMKNTLQQQLQAMSIQ